MTSAKYTCLMRNKICAVALGHAWEIFLVDSICCRALCQVLLNQYSSDLLMRSSCSAQNNSRLITVVMFLTARGWIKIIIDLFGVPKSLGLGQPTVFLKAVAPFYFLFSSLHHFLFLSRALSRNLNSGLSFSCSLCTGNTT